MRYCLAAVQIAVTAMIVLINSSCSTVGDLVVPWHDNSYANEGKVTTKVIIGQGETYTNELAEFITDALYLGRYVVTNNALVNYAAITNALDTCAATTNALVNYAAITNALVQYAAITNKAPPKKIDDNKSVPGGAAAAAIAINVAYKLTEKVITAERKKSTTSYSKITPTLISDNLKSTNSPLFIKILQFDKLDFDEIDFDEADEEAEKILKLCHTNEIETLWKIYSENKKAGKETDKETAEAKERYTSIKKFASPKPNIEAQFVLLNKGDPTNGYAQIQLESFKVRKTQAKAFGWGGKEASLSYFSYFWPPYWIVGFGQMAWNLFEDIHIVDMQVNLSLEFIYNGKVAEIGPIPFNVKVDLDESDDEGYLKCTPKESVSRYFPYPYTSKILAANITVNLIQTNEAHSELLTKAEEEYKKSKKDIEAFLKDLPDHLPPKK